LDSPRATPPSGRRTQFFFPFLVLPLSAAFSRLFLISPSPDFERNIPFSNTQVTGLSFPARLLATRIFFFRRNNFIPYKTLTTVCFALTHNFISFSWFKVLMTRQRTAPCPLRPSTFFLMGCFPFFSHILQTVAGHRRFFLSPRNPLNCIHMQTDLVSQYAPHGLTYKFQTFTFSFFGSAISSPRRPLAITPL